MNFKSLYLSVFCLALMILLAACAGPATPSGSDIATESMVEATGRGAEDQLKILFWQAVSFMNPYLASGAKEIDAASLVLEPLARYNEEGEMVPWLAEEIPTVENGGISEDLTTISWKLKEGILWSDGTPFTADDVVFTAEYCMLEDMGCTSKSRFYDVEQVEALDELTVKITFSKPTPFPYMLFVGRVTPIMQQAQFVGCLGEKAQQCTEQNFAPIGTGPYKVVEFKPNDIIRFEPNETYRDPNKPFFKEVVIKGGGASASAARSVLKNGEADYVWNLQMEPQILQDLEAGGQGKVVSAFSSQIERLFINFTNPDPDLGDLRSEWSVENPNPHPFLTDDAVREALSLAIDRSVIVDQLYGIGGQVTCNAIPAPSIYASSNNDDCLTQNIKKANAILDEAGWLPGADGIREKNGVRLSLLFQTSTNSVRQNTQALIKQWWKEIGVETELRNIEAGVFFGGDLASPDTLGKFYADVQMFRGGMADTDPEIYLTGFSCSNISSSANQWTGQNISRWCNEDYDNLLDELSNTAGLEKRAQLVIQLNDILIQNYVIFPLVYRGSVSAHSNTLEGVEINAWDSEFWNIADWTRN